MRDIFLFCLIFLFSNSLLSQNFTISGYVQEESNGENLIGVSVYDQSSNKGTSTNQYGFYSITLPKGKYNIIYSFIGLQTQVREVDLNKNQRINIAMIENSTQLQEVEIAGERLDENIEKTNMSQVKLKIQNVKTIPAILGEVDVLKAAQLLPGISNGGEGNSGLYVRGGGPDQNLVLLDEAVVYNAAHLFGFFSVFNADAIKDMNIIKGGMPAEYGGRLSSVIDISMKDGNNKKFQADGGIGLLSSRLTLQGPLEKNKSSFIISGRRTYVDVLSKPFLNKDNPDTGEPNPFAGSGYYFYDLTTKINYKISDKDRIFLSGYFGRDVFNFSDSESGFGIEIPWGNATTSLRWNHLFSEKLFMNTSLIFTDYRFEFNIAQSDFELRIFSGINDWNSKTDFLYIPNQKHKIKFGTNFTYHIFTPGNATGRSGEVIFSPDEIFKQYSNESAIYISDDFEINDVLKLNIGLRYSSFQHSGDINPLSFLQNELKFDTNNHYRHLEPRVSMRYKLDATSSLKASYSENYQYIHLASTGSVSLPTDLWVPSSDVVKPKFSKQLAAGYFKNFSDNMFETSMELYYKEMDNLIEYKEGILPEDNTNSSSDNSFTFGNGNSYGIEILTKKNKGKMTGWIGYTLSKTTRFFDEINNGDPYPAKYDRRHDLSITSSYKISDSWELSSVFVYATGNSITLPSERYIINGNIYTEYTTRNGYRMIPYHRLDFGATYNPKKGKKFNSSWNFSIYNLYNRKNPYFIYLGLEDSIEGENGNIQNGNLIPKAYQVSIFPILPSITWNFNF
ncbi:MAG: TonB-dependent receptor [Flavobacteriales bacterium]|nr:TonB-dependent receptor [Flavobacteriales bacterium]